MEMQALALHAVFEDNKVFGSVIESWQGPATLIFRIRLHSFDKRTVDRVGQLREPIQVALHQDRVNVRIIAGVVHVEIPSPYPVSVPGAKLRGSGLRVPIGATGRLTDEGGIETVDVDFANPTSPHLAVVGATGTGKTTAMQALCFHLARQNSTSKVRFVVIGPENKMHRWGRLTDIPHFAPAVSDFGEVKQVLRWAANLATTRKVGAFPHWFILLDDLLTTLKSVDVKAELATLAAQGREPGVHLIIGSQKMGEAGIGGSDVASNMRARLLLGAASAQDAALLSGRAKTGAENLEGFGDAVLVNGQRQDRVAVSMVNDSDYVGTFGSPRPWVSWPWLGWGEPVYKPAAPDPLEALRQLKPGDPLPEGPLMKMSEPGEREKEMLQELYRLTGFKTNETLRIAYGGRNGRVGKWLKGAIE